MSVDFEQIIQWYPGHMVTAMRKIEEHMRLIDVVIEVVDARVPASGVNPMLDSLIGRRKRMIIMNREDLADPLETVKWLGHYKKIMRRAIATNAKEQSSVAKAYFHLGQLSGGQNRSSQRAIVLGLPNSGKSSVINGLLRRAAAKTEDRAGVTRATQWFRVQPMLELMDTPGILVPKIETAQAQWMLAITGAVPRDHYDPEDVAGRFYDWVSKRGKAGGRVPSLEAFAAARGFLRRAGEADMHNAARSYIKDFNDGKFGRFTFESVPDESGAA
ncbi:MAG: ribosome biogenesis GTPase YlqF [Candidatus Eremiobacteraeota bacterium]|nr:ribosome biogenesis GTPase YlqF [Candidatus Eremiobacteraeota bacterium]